MTKFKTYLQRSKKVFLQVMRPSALIKKPKFLAAGATIAFCIVFAGAFLSQNPSVISLAPEQIGLGQGVAACFGSLGPSCNDSGRNNLSFSWNETAAAGHWPNCDTNGDSSLRVNLHDSGGNFVQSLGSSVPCSGSSSFSSLLTGGVGYQIWVLGNNSGHTYERYSFTAVSCAPPPNQPTAQISGTLSVYPSSPCVAAPGASTCQATISWNTQNALESVAQGAGPLWPSGASIDGPTTNSSGNVVQNLPIGEYLFSVSGKSSAGWGTPLSERIYYVVPAAPATMSASCNTGGTSVNLSWSASAGASVYYPRVAPVAQGACSSIGWQWLSSNGGICYKDQLSGTSVASFPINPGTTYSAWVHAGNPVSWAHAAGTSFTCAGVAPTWTPYCTGGADPNGNNWQWWQYSNTNPVQYQYIRPGDGTCTAASATPDLTVSGITPTSAVAGTPTTFSATVTNTGGGSTNIGFQNFYQVRSNTAAAAPHNIFTKLFNIAHAAEIITDLAASNMGALAAGGSGVATQNYTFPAAGTYGVRVCADKANSGDAVGVIAETDETNNCGGWTDVNVTAACTVGGACSVSNACNYATGTYDSGCNCSATVPPVPATYGNSCTSSANVCGQTSSGTVMCNGSCSASTPSKSLCLPTIEFSADPMRVRKDTSTKLTWRSTDATSCSLVGQNGFTSSDLSGTAVDSGPLDAQTKFTLTCSNTYSPPSVSESVIVNLLPSYIEQ